MRELERDFPATPPDFAPASLGCLTIVGTGRAGGAIARAAGLARIETTAVGRNEGILPDSDVVLLCVPDAAIPEVCESVVQRLASSALVGHVSGASPLTALERAADTGHRVFSMHPLQTIPTPETDLTGAPCGVAGGDTDALAFAHALAARLGMLPFDVQDEGRAAYHAAASIASNFLVALEESAASLMTFAGIADPRGVLQPLVLRTAANWAESGAAALTGPIARGDDATVERHRQTIQDLAPELAPLYEALAERTRAIAQGSAS